MCHTVDAGTLQDKPLPWDQAEPHNRGRAHICSHVLYICTYALLSSEQIGDLLARALLAHS